VLAALALTLAGVLAGAVVLVLLRRAAAFALAGVLARAAVVAGLAVAVALARVEAFTSMLVGFLLVGSHLHGLRGGLVETERVRPQLNHAHPPRHRGAQPGRIADGSTARRLRRSGGERRRRHCPLHRSRAAEAAHHHLSISGHRHFAHLSALSPFAASRGPRL